MADLAFAGRIHASQVALLPGLPPIGRALVIGGGTALPDFKRAFSKAGVEVVTSRPVLGGFLRAVLLRKRAPRESPV